jgi:uridine kinase
LGVWDFSVFLAVGVDEILRRVRIRDAALFGSSDAAERRYWTRCLPAQQLYFATADPESSADVVVRNDDPRRPVIVSAPAALIGTA